MRITNTKQMIVFKPISIPRRQLAGVQPQTELRHSVAVLPRTIQPSSASL